jgi:mannose-1-phosphate guanylyltransferase
MGKNTAACIGWAAVELLKRDPEAVMVIMPADHYVAPVKAFQKVIFSGVNLVEKSPEALVTIGIVPEFPHTGYGYIEVDRGTKKSSGFAVKAFHEKPSLETATSYLNKGNFYWNSGIFIWKAKTILSLFEKYLPGHFEGCQKLALLSKGRDYQRNLKALFEQFENISIDYGIMEKAFKQTRLIPSEFEWSDIGSWSSLQQFWKKDEHLNAANGKLIPLNSAHNLVYSPHKTVALIGVEGLTVIDTEDAILIVPTDQDQQIRDLVSKLPSSLT